MKKVIIKGITAAAIMTFLMTGAVSAAATGDEMPEWGIYLYMCGSDLESEAGAATDDLVEMLNAELPAGVTVVVETGGASEWQNETVDPDYLERYVIGGENFDCVDQQPLASMGESETFADFLSFCTEQYPAEKEAVILWNHGGGSIEGVAFDELFDYDALTLAEMKEAFASVFGEQPGEIPLEMVGFDACLMATVETANVLEGYAGYMVASEEQEPGCGWDYASFLHSLGEDTGISGDRLGELICDSFLEGCKAYGDYLDCTLSVVDVTAAGALVEAYDAMGTEALLYACEDASYFSKFGRGAKRAENYGINTDSAGYSGMVDLGDLAEHNRELIPDSYEDVVSALDDCVVYTVNGSYKTGASGLSCYYALDGNAEDLESFTGVCASDSFSVYYDYMLTGELEEEYQEYVSEVLGYEGTYVQPDTLSAVGAEEEDLPLIIDENGCAVLELDGRLTDALSDICFELYLYDEEDLIYLGTDNDMEADWENGIFRDNFRGVWGCLDGCLCHMEVSYTCDDYTFYSIPILLNGEKCNLKVIYDYNDEEYHILGAGQGIDDNGMAGRNTVQLKPGDRVTILHYGSSVDDYSSTEEVETEELTVTEDTAFTEEQLVNGRFMLFFRLEDVQGQDLYSQAVYIDIEDGAMSIDPDPE